MSFNGEPYFQKGQNLSGNEVLMEVDAEISQVCKCCIDREKALFRDLADEDLSKFGQLIVGEVNLCVGDILYRQGGAGEYVYMVREGLIKLEQFLPDGNQRIVRLAKSGSAIALEVMLGSDFQHQAVALQKTRVCRLSREVLTKIETETPKLHGQLMAFWHESLSDADTWLTQLSTGSARARMSRLFLLLLDSAYSFDMPSREDIGAMLGITTETASRTVAEFRRLGAISPVAPRCFVANRDQLEEISGVKE